MPQINRILTLCQCLRCGNEWAPRVPNPVRCPACGSVLWNTERAQQLAGKPAPTRKGAARGKPFNSDFDPRRTRNKKAAEDI